MKSYDTQTTAPSKARGEHLPKPASGEKDVAGRSMELQETVGNAAVAAELSDEAAGQVDGEEICMAVYSVIGPGYDWETTGMDEIEGAARDFAEDHRCWGLDGGALVHGRDAAFGAVSPSEASGCVIDVLAALEDELGRPVKVKTLALFAHGQPGGLGIGSGLATNPHESDETSAEDFAAALDSALTGDATVVLYACKAGSTSDEAGSGGFGSDEQGGEGSFGDVLRDELTAGPGNENRSVYARQISGHTAGNPTWRHYEGRQEAGEDASEPLFDEDSDHYIAQKARTAICNWLRAGLGADVDPDWLYTWVGRELPFAPSNCRPFSARADDAPFEVENRYLFRNDRYAVNPALVEWFTQILPEHTSSESED
ncbi:MAG: hypothetical protein JRI25_17945 [Deltaproteobacteria bacterium]|nr:hypothetical protein [Deltaproteobacteria bacterium]